LHREKHAVGGVEIIISSKRKTMVFLRASESRPARRLTLRRK
jgi:hypothetical protein